MKHIFLFALITIPCCAAPNKNILYQEGKKTTKYLLSQMMTSTDEKQLFTELPKLDPELQKVMTILQREELSSPVYKESFVLVQDYYKGVNDTLNDIAVNQIHNEVAQKLLNFLRSVADAFLSSTNHFEATKKLGTLLSTHVEQYKAHFPQLPKLILYTPNPEDPFYKKGYECGNNTTAIVTLQLQGKEVTAEEQMKVALEFSNIMQEEFSDINTPDDPRYPLVAMSIVQFLAGAEQALEDYPLEALIKKYGTPELLAQRMRISFPAGAEMFRSLKEIFIEGDLSKLSEIGFSLEKLGTSGEQC